MPDPIDNFLEDLGRARGRVRTDLARLPGSDPLQALLKEVDRVISRTETDIRAAKTVALEAMVQQYSFLRETNLPGLGKIREISTRLPGGGSATMIGFR